MLQSTEYFCSQTRGLALNVFGFLKNHLSIIKPFRRALLKSCQTWEEVYIFEDHEELAAWAQSSMYAEKVSQLENKRKLLLEFAQKHHTIEDFKKTGKLNQDFAGYYSSLDPNQADYKTSLFLSLRANKNGKGSALPILSQVPYVFLPFFDNKASSVDGGLVFFLTLFEDTFYGGKSIIVLINTPDLSIYGFNDKASSALTL